MINYWSCSKFADWLRGTSKPEAETLENWNVWHKSVKQSHKLRYWLAETALDNIQKAILLPYNTYKSFFYFIKKVFLYKTHCLPSSNFKLGEWHDLDYRILNCNFTALKDFVEIECAHLNYWSLTKEERKKIKLDFWQKLTKIWRNPQLGIDYLTWSSNLVIDENWVEKTDPTFGKPTGQALGAKEILEIYHWWIKRKDLDIWDDSALIEFYKNNPTDFTSVFDNDTRPDNVKQEEKALITKRFELEEFQKNQDTEMLCRLMKVRHHLWT